MEQYKEIVSRVLRMHQLIDDVLGSEKRLSGLAPSQAMLLYLLDGQVLSANDVRRTCHFGSNVSYNLTRLEASGYITREVASDDRRRVMIQATPAGREIASVVSHLFEKQQILLEQAYSDPEEIAKVSDGLKRLERGLIDQVRFGL